MNEFVYSYPMKVYFGNGAAAKAAAAELGKFGKTVLLAYGGGSIKKNGVYDEMVALLKNAGLISSSQGRSGYQLTKSPKDITLLEIYFATQEVEHIRLFQIHQHANRECPVGKNIEGAMAPIFSSVEQDLEKQLSQQTLEDVIDNLYQEAKLNRI